MSDCFHVFGSDLATDASGDVLMVSGDTMVQQRIIRRLLTVNGNYIWELDYGAGVGTLIGTLATKKSIQNLVRQQIFLEETVAKVPEPVVAVSSDQMGNVIVQITYTDNQTGVSQTLTLPST